jgi:hypothetical protein
LRTSLDVGVGAETPVSLDTGVDVPRDATALDLYQPDAPINVQPDAPADTRDGPADVAAPDTADAADIANNDLPSDLPSDLSVIPPDTADGPSADTADAAAGPSCSNPTWAKMFAMRNNAGLSGDKEGNLFLANILFSSIAFGGTVGTVTTTGDSDALVVRFDPVTGGAAWAKNFGDKQAQSATGVAVDKSGRVGFIGNYQGSMAVGSSSLSNLGTWPFGYVGALQDTDGTGLWAIQASLSADEGSSGILAAIAANPNFDNFVICGNTNIAATDLVPNAVAGGGYDIVVAKIAAGDGSVLWSRQIGGTGDQSCTAAAIDDSGNVMIAGDFNGQLDFGGASGPFTITPGTTSHVTWVAKLSGSDGSTMSAKNASPAATGKTTAYVNGIDTDSAGNVAIAGILGFGSETFGSTKLTSAGLNDALVVKMDPSLVPIWALNWGDAKSQEANSVGFDSTGNLTVVGDFFGTINIAPSGSILTASSDTTGSNTDIFFARLTGTTGSSQCALRYGDPAAQSAYNVFIPRHATGELKDATFAAGSLVGTSVLDFGTASFDTTALPDPAYLWLARF